MGSVKVKVLNTRGELVKREMRKQTLSDTIKYLRKLGCTGRRGKGSEVVMYSPDGKDVHTLGGHGAHREQHPCEIRKALAALRISVDDWMKVAR